MSTDPKLKRAFQVIVILLMTVIFLGGWRIRDRIREREDLFVFDAGSTSENFARIWYPEVDWSKIYPGFSDEEIDQIQRQTFAVRYVYQPYVQFGAWPKESEFVNIGAGGVRKNAGPTHPWPPDASAFNVFVFGGSTIFGYGLPDWETVVSSLESQFRASLPQQTVRCYNFGAGYYFSTQERVLFENLLLRGHRPNVALFIDGLNDFRQLDGAPEFTSSLHDRMAPDIPRTLPPRPENDAAREVTAQLVLERYQRNVQLIESAAQRFGVGVFFLAQPVPFGDYPINAATYPFTQPNEEHRLCAIGYAPFAKMAEARAFGTNFVWAADAFRDAKEAMYCDAVHYSPRGAKRLAQVIFERVTEQLLLRQAKN
ncbi:MAG: SGNH/GDSL hydrolase family protein [Limisphaerales bacterium]